MRVGPWHRRHQARTPRRSTHGFTLIECAAVCAVIGVLTAVALPSYRGHLLRAARGDAVDALTRLHAAQERHRSLTGLYADDMQPLRGAGIGTTSSQGRYTLLLAATGPDSYRASAIPTGSQAQDIACPELTLDVQAGFAQPGPHPRCWNR